MPKITVYHNPRCSKSRATLELLRQQQIEPQIIEYLQTPPSVSELKAIVQLLQIPPRELLRSKESAYKDHGLDDVQLSDDAIIDAMHKHPILIERPIVINHDQQRAVIGRPPENVLNLL